MHVSLVLWDISVSFFWTLIEATIPSASNNREIVCGCAEAKWGRKPQQLYKHVCAPHEINIFQLSHKQLNYHFLLFWSAKCKSSVQCIGFKNCLCCYSDFQVFSLEKRSSKNKYRKWWTFFRMGSQKLRFLCNRAVIKSKVYLSLINDLSVTKFLRFSFFCILSFLVIIKNAALTLLIFSTKIRESTSNLQFRKVPSANSRLEF